MDAPLPLGRAPSYRSPGVGSARALAREYSSSGRMIRRERSFHILEAKGSSSAYDRPGPHPKGVDSMAGQPTNQVGHVRSRPLGRRTAGRRAVPRAVHRERHPALGAGHAEREPAVLRRGLRGAEHLRPDRRAPVVHRELHGGPRRGSRHPGLHRGHAHALRRRRVVVLRARASSRATASTPSACSSTTWSRRPSSPAPRCSRAATPPTSTSAARSWRSSAPPRSATTPTRRCAAPTTA